MIRTSAMLMDELKHFVNPQSKIHRLVAKGELVPIVRGLYETDKNIPGYYLVGSIYGPSYLSFDFAMGLSFVDTVSSSSVHICNL